MAHITLVVIALAALGLAKCRAAEPDAEKLLAERVVVSAIVFGPAKTKDPKPLAGALVLDKEKRFVLASSTNVPDAPTVMFPTFTARGELNNTPGDYIELWKKGNYWGGKAIHRDKELDLVVIELDRTPPDRTQAAELRAESAEIGSVVFALNSATPGKKVWELGEGRVRSIGVERYLAPDPTRRKIRSE